MAILVGLIWAYSNAKDIAFRRKSEDTFETLGGKKTVCWYKLSERQLLSFQVTCSAKISPAGSSPLNDHFFPIQEQRHCELCGQEDTWIHPPPRTGGSANKGHRATGHTPPRAAGASKCWLHGPPASEESPSPPHLIWSPRHSPRLPRKLSSFTRLASFGCTAQWICTHRASSADISKPTVH